MSKSSSGHFKGTKGDIINLIHSLPKKPNKKFFEDWEDITNPEAKKKILTAGFLKIKKQDLKFDLTLQKMAQTVLKEKIIGTFIIQIKPEKKTTTWTKTAILSRKAQKRRTLFQKVRRDFE